MERSLLKCRQISQTDLIVYSQTQRGIDKTENDIRRKKYNENKTKLSGICLMSDLLLFIYRGFSQKKQDQLYLYKTIKNQMS
jgi:transposase-like protein